MKIIILVDMEGISGICRRSQVMPDGEHYQDGRRYMTWDVNACVRGCRDGGATEVVVRDVHLAGFNLVWHELDPGARYIMGRSREGRMPGLESCDGLVLLGYHAMAGTPKGILEHTFNSRLWQNCWMNGEKAGELAIDGAAAGECDVPVIMVSGDDKTCEEAAALFEGAVCIEVKKGIDIEGGVLLPLSEAHERIRGGARQAVANLQNIRPYRVKTPVTMRVELVSRGVIPRDQTHLKVVDGRTYETTAGSVAQALNLLVQQ